MDGSVQYSPPERVFAGRALELELLAEALAAASSGEPQIALVQGEAGIGKSWLVFEFLGRHPEMPVIAASGEAAETVLDMA